VTSYPGRVDEPATVRADFQLEPDAEARAWMESRPARDPLVVEYDVHRCCGGGKICQVRVREKTQTDQIDRFVGGHLDDGTQVYIDRRAAARLPTRFGLTLRGRGRTKHLDLQLDAQQWGDLLYT